MTIFKLGSRGEFAAGDGSRLSELFHADKDRLALGYSLARAVVGPGGRTLPHRLKGSEVYYIIGGRGIMHVGGESAEVVPDDAVYIPPGAIQFIENPGTGDLVFLCIVEPAWKAEDEEVLEATVERS
jgi:mannose-6-phosphate isomerase-like protein (cupin superfamily)